MVSALALAWPHLTYWNMFVTDYTGDEINEIFSPHQK